MTLEGTRTRINGIDDQLLPLLVARFNHGREVAAIKQKSGDPILNPDRKHEILDRMRGRAGGYDRKVRVICTACMEASRPLQHQLFGGKGDLRVLIQSTRDRPPSGGRIACQGVEGAYSHQATLRLFSEGELSFSHIFGNVFEILRQGTTGFRVLPVENSSAGSVTRVYDLILKYHFLVAAATAVKVDHYLVIPEGARREELKTMYSHPQALTRCSKYLNNNDLSAGPFSSTAAAAKIAVQQGGSIGVICSQQAAETYGPTILDHSIQSSHSNCARFVAVCHDPIILLDAQKISLCFSLPHTTDLLSGVLSRFATHGLNLAKIKSRSSVNKNFKYNFYLDFSSSVRKAGTLDLITALHEELPRSSFLGNYWELGTAP